MLYQVHTTLPVLLIAVVPNHAVFTTRKKKSMQYAVYIRSCRRTPSVRQSVSQPANQSRQWCHCLFPSFYYYRKYRSLGPPPRLTFQARLLHNQEDVNTDRCVQSKLSTRSFENRPFRHRHSLGSWSNRAWKVSLGGVPRLRYLTVF